MGREQNNFGLGQRQVRAVKEMERVNPCLYHKTPADNAAAENGEETSLRQGVTVVMSRWRGLQMAVQNEWGGRDSRQKYNQLVVDVSSCLTQARAVCLEELENFLNECMLLSFNTEIEDGSIEVVAEKLMMLHEEYLHGIHA